VAGFFINPEEKGKYFEVLVLATSHPSSPFPSPLSFL